MSPTRSSSSAIRGFCSPGGHRVELGEVAQVVVRGEALVQPALAPEHVADPLPHLARVLDHVEPEHARRPRRGDQERDQHLDRRRLAGPVRPEQAEQLARADLEAHAAHGLDLERPASGTPRSTSCRCASGPLPRRRSSPSRYLPGRGNSNEGLRASSPFRVTPFQVGLRILAPCRVSEERAFSPSPPSCVSRADGVLRRRARSAGPVLSETILTPATGATVTKKVTWTVQVSGAAATRVEFAVDGKLSSRQSPSSKVTGVRTYGSRPRHAQAQGRPAPAEGDDLRERLVPGGDGGNSDGRQRPGPGARRRRIRSRSP